MQQTIDQLLRAEKAGIIPRNIIKQCIEWQATVYLNFIVYEKAFDSIHCESLWAILHQNGIPLASEDY